MVELPEDAGDPDSIGTGTTVPQGDDSVNHQVSTGEVRRLEEMVAMLQHQLEVRERETQQLHILLQQSQAALPAPKEDHHSWWRFWHR